MAIKHYDVTIGAAATQITSAADQLQWAVVQSPASNGAVYIGGATVTSTSYGYAIAASGGAVTVGPGTQGHPIVANSMYLFGTEDDVVHVLGIT